MTGDNMKKIQSITLDLLREIGEDPDREGLQKTPERVARAWNHFIKGYGETPEEVVGDAIFEELCDEIVIVKEIDFFSLCEHHLLPFKGCVNVGYLPDNKIIGLSKIPRIVDIYARRLQVQERMTQQIADALQQVLNPKGVAVIMEAEHLCMQMRGVEKKASFMVTSAVRGAFEKNQKTRDEFLSIVSTGRT
ncbi:MAG: GTP cyclohydrolase I FolE [Candidatus Marinimicrobia bacterium]|jgi:GTP cyclohydrolase I|nr:GTP cyclohydrolase I FolE [Candidatus Neomarinimicrobiota bacterium]MDP6593616.1 GTP cyclohydrolase I FolE [Candidatus Neomarinimicrobiota bacterium]MDP6836233.1 GTP cyclohydrolase I FolE [Candidatus Neomarinimicrobiota bacterium]|tara:strand:+ start:2613 stop:3188 length:576 start_codon:yes stop_codon:yes gene_type:complete